MPSNGMRTAALVLLTLCMGTLPFAVHAARAKLSAKPTKIWIDNVHGLIPSRGVDRESLRLIILKGMRNAKTSWYMESESPDAIVARFDYKLHSIAIKVVYDEKYIRFLYAGAIGYECRELSDGICTDNDRGYYNHGKNLRNSIGRELKQFRSRR